MKKILRVILLVIPFTAVGNAFAGQASMPPLRIEEVLVDFSPDTLTIKGQASTTALRPEFDAKMFAIELTTS